MTSSPSYHQAVADNFPYISSTPLDLPALLAMAHHPKAGAVVLFSGETRNSSHNKKVAYLQYEAHETMARKMISEILKEAVEKWSLNFAIAQHRIGKVAICESAVAIITCSPHRTEGYAANRYVIDRIKHEAPIWKCEYFTDGTKEWGGNCNCYAITGDPDKHIYISP